MESDASDTKPDDFFPGLFGAAEHGRRDLRRPERLEPRRALVRQAALAAAGITEDPATLAENGEWTTEKYLEMNDKLAEAGLTGSMFWNYWATHYSWISSQGGTAYDESGAFVGNEDATTSTRSTRSADTSRTAPSSWPTPCPRARAPTACS